MALFKSVLFTGAQTAGEILDPTTGTLWVLRRLTLTTTGTAIVSIFDETDASGTQVFKQRITDGYERVWHRDDHTDKEKDGFRRSAAVNNKLEITYPEGVNAYVTIEYYEEP